MARRLSVAVACMVSCVLWLPGSLQEESGTGSVLELDDASFQATVDAAELAVVAFRAPWCHHCHTYITDVFSPAADQLGAEGITMATLDIEAAKEVQSKYVIREVPAVKLFRRGMMFPYEGPGQHMGVPGLVHYLRKEKTKSGLEESPVITLTNENFDDIIEASELILVEFYTDMCVQCQQLEPHFISAARQLLTNQPPVQLGRVQIPDQMEVAKRFPLEGYPLLIMFRHGRQYNYTGPKDTAGIVEYMQQQVGPSSILLEHIEDVKKFTSTREISVVGYFTEDTDSVLLREFLESGNLVRTDMKLGHTQKEGVALKMKQQSETIVVYHPTHLVSEYESGFSVITDPPANATELRQLYLDHARPLVGHMTKRNYDSVYKHRPLLLAYYEVDWSVDGFKATQYWHSLLASVVREFCHSDIVFAVANEEEYPNDLRALGLSDWGEEVAVGLFAPGPLKYPLTDELSRDSLTDFIQGYMDGELRPHFSSEPPPKPVKGTLIRKVVGSTFKTEVLTKKRHVMVLLCIPSLPDCKKASDYYPKLASQFKAVKDLTFAEMNVALNDPPVGTKVDSLPTFLFSPKGSEEILEVTPQPKDEADLAFFLKWKQDIKPQGSKFKKQRSKRDEL